MKHTRLPRKAVTILTLLLFVQTSLGAFNAYLELTINGSAVDGESSLNNMGGIDVSRSIECIAFNHEMFATGDAKQNRVHGPIKFVKRVDKSSPQLYQGFNDNAPADATFRFFRTDPNSGVTQHYYTINLTNARITGIRHWFPNTTDTIGSFLPQMEEITFTYETITIIHELSSSETSITVTP